LELEKLLALVLDNLSDEALVLELEKLLALVSDNLSDEVLVLELEKRLVLVSGLVLEMAWEMAWEMVWEMASEKDLGSRYSTDKMSFGKVQLVQIDCETRQ